jgi:hypothetical protein
MNEQQNVTLGEVYRLCQSIDTRLREQNGRVSALERDAIRLKTVWVGAVILLGFGIDWLKHKLGIS